MTNGDSVEHAAELEPPLAVGSRIKRRVVLAWGLWDWGSSAYSAVIVLRLRPVRRPGVVGDASRRARANTWLGISSAAAGLLIALIAPITGQRADAGGHRKRSLAIWSALVIAVMFGMYTVKDEPSYLDRAGAAFAGAVFQEFAVVSYNAIRAAGLDA